uniref:Uncharacterized protein n=1 Tax=Halimeda minima TaxID=170427 RepID=A0A386AZ10_9CHLO|nr:hypothetical protein [Halimeda minima]
MFVSRVSAVTQLSHATLDLSNAQRIRSVKARAISKAPEGSQSALNKPIRGEFGKIVSPFGRASVRNMFANTGSRRELDTELAENNNPSDSGLWCSRKGVTCFYYRSSLFSYF